MIRFRRARRAAALGLPLLIYAGVAFLLFGRGGLWRGGVLGYGPDPVTLTWFLNWWPFALGHGLNPFVTHYVWFPHGFNLAWATSVPLLALLMAPVTWLASPLLSFNLLTLAAPALAAWTGFLLCEDITEDWLAALVGGYLFGFSSYELGQLVGHLNLDFICLVPLVVLLSLRRARGDLSGRAYIAGLTACLLAELGIATEILATLCVFGAGSWAVFLLFARGDERGRLWRMAFEIVAAALLTMLLAAPFFYFLVKGLADVPPSINAAQAYVTDPRNFLIPTNITWLNSPYFAPIAAQFAGNGSEQGGYLGLPLLLLLGLFYIRQISRAYVFPLLVVTMSLMICSLGPLLRIGQVVTHIPLPWLLSQDLPLIGCSLPSRFSMYIALATAIAAAMMLAGARGWWRGLCYVLAAAAVISLLPRPALVPWLPWPANPFFTARNITAQLGRMPNLLIFPFAQNGPGMAWQLDAHMSFTQTGGYAGFIPAAEAGYPEFNTLAFGAPLADAAEALDRICAGHDVDYILLGPGTAPDIIAAVKAQGWPAQARDGITIVKVPPASAMDFYTLTGDYWPSPAAWNWMGKKITITTHRSPLHLQLLGVWTRPSPSLRLSVTIGGTVQTYAITEKSSVARITVPAQATATIEANQTWVPGPADPRALSVIVQIDRP